MAVFAANIGTRRLRASSKSRDIPDPPRVHLLRVGSLLFWLASAAAFVIGWHLRQENLVTAEQGLGYWLGVAGTASMVLLLVYPLRKRIGALSAVGSVAAWFRIHMMLGVVGPILILYHANFRLGSTNANIALVSMLLVAASGLIGRYLYGKIYRGSAARIADVMRFLDEFDRSEGAVAVPQFASETVLIHMRAFAEAEFAWQLGAARRRAGRWSPLWLRLHRTRRAIFRDLTDHQSRARPRPVMRARRAESRRATHLYGEFSNLVLLAARAALFERLFALWHLLHLPLFVLLVVAATLHIVAVHIY